MKFSAIHRFLLIFFLFVGSSCSGKLTGAVFLDLNGDTEKASNEPKLAHLPFTVTRDDVDFATGTTDANGKFSVKITKGGTYCVQVTTGDLIDADVTLVSSLRLPTLLEQQVDPVHMLVSQVTTTDTTETDCSDNIDNDDDGLIDCDDTTDCSTDSACDTTTTTDTGSSGSSGSESRESGSSCKDSGSSARLELTVPVSKNYSVDDILAEDPVSATLGEDVPVVIKYPDSCLFDAFSLPAGIEPAASFPTSSYDSLRRRINFRDAIVEDVANVTTTDSTSFFEDDISTYTFDVTVNDDLLSNADIELTPTMDCPDSSTVTLKTFTISVDTTDLFRVTTTVTSGTVASAATIVLTTSIRNLTEVDYIANEVTLVFAASATANFTLPSVTGCTASSSAATCEFALGAGDTETFATTVVLPTIGTDAVTATLTATLTVSKGGDSVEEVDTFSRTLSP